MASTTKTRAIRYRPFIDWPYSRRSGDFQSHLDDLWFWGYINTCPFRRIFTAPGTGMLCIEHKNSLNKIQAEFRGGGQNNWFSGGKVHHKSKAHVPPAIELIRFQSKLNRD